MTKHSKLLKTTRRDAIALGWDHPFFLIPSARVKFRIDEKGRITKTAAITTDGVIFLHPPFIEKLKPAERQGVIAHELMHMVMLHYFRRGSREAVVLTEDGPVPLWFIACDMAINGPLRKAGITLPAEGVFPPPEWDGWNTERIYAEMLQQAQNNKSGEGMPLVQPGQQTGMQDQTPGAGCGVKPPTAGNGDQEAKGKANGTKTDATLEREWREVAAAASAMQRSQGRGAGDVLVQALEIPAPRVNWSAVLRRGMATAIAAHGRDAQTWSRRGRRSQAVGPQFPGWQTNSAKCAVVIDTSGSMSDDDLAQCVAETTSIAKESSVAVYLVTHDDGVQWEGWLVPKCQPKAIKQALRGRGGTCAHEAYERVGSATKRFDCMIHLTDGWLNWPTWPTNVRKPVVALMGHGSKDTTEVPEGALVVEVE